MTDQLVTHLGIGAHQDDLEIMALHGIGECYYSDSKSFVGVTCASGSGSARSGDYRSTSDAHMIDIRHKEQLEAARIGKYADIIQLGLSSSIIKDPSSDELLNHIVNILRKFKPRFIYTHNPADKHATHIGVVVNVIKALRILKDEYCPVRVIGCEVWRDLDWLDDKEKIHLDVSSYQGLLKNLLSVYRSQIDGGKDYLNATVGRMVANATYSSSHSVDRCTHLWYGVDLMPLVDEPALEISIYLERLLNTFAKDVTSKLREFETKK